MTPPVDTVDLSTCDREPIHIPGMIQNHGCLLVCDPTDWSVTHVSENLGEFLPLQQSSVLTLPLKDVVGIDPR